MEFLGIGYQELLLVLGLLLVVVGPERLPNLAYQIGRAVRTMQKYARAVRDEFSDEISYVEEQYKVVRGEVDSARSELRAQQQEWSAELKQPLPPLDSPPSLNGSTNGTMPSLAEPEVPALNGTSETASAPKPPGTPPMVF